MAIKKQRMFIQNRTHSTHGERQQHLAYSKSSTELEAVLVYLDFQQLHTEYKVKLEKKQVSSVHGNWCKPLYPVI